MNLNHIGHSHIIPAVTVLLFTLLYAYLYFKQITQYTHYRYFEI